MLPNNRQQKRRSTPGYPSLTLIFRRPPQSIPQSEAYWLMTLAVWAR